jgi:hypothetical protein
MYRTQHVQFFAQLGMMGVDSAMMRQCSLTVFVRVGQDTLTFIGQSRLSLSRQHLGAIGSALAGGELISDAAACLCFWAVSDCTHGLSVLL